jgi:hypothetical protein
VTWLDQFSTLAPVTLMSLVYTTELVLAIITYWKRLRVLRQ